MRFLDAIPMGSPRLKHTLFRLLVLFIAYTLFGFFAVPPLAKRLIVSNAGKALNRPVTLAEVSFNPLTLHTEITDFAVETKDGDSRFIAFKRLEVAPGLSSIFRLAPVVNSLKIVDLRVEASHLGRNRYSFSDLLTPADPAAKDAGIFPFALHGLDVSNATVVFHDVPRGKTHVVSEINLRVPFTSTIKNDSKDFTEPVFSAVVNGDTVEMQGRTLPFDETLRTEFQVGAMNLNLSRYWDYLPVKTPLVLESGTFTSNMSVVFETKDGFTSLFLAGGGTLKDMVLTAGKDNKVLGIKGLTFDMERFSLRDSFLSLKQVSISALSIKLIRRQDNSLNWLEYRPKPTSENVGGEPSQESPPFRVDIQTMQMAGGSIDWQDRTVAGGFSRTVTPLNMKVTGFSTVKGDRFNCDLDIPDERAAIHVTGEASLTPLAATVEVEAKNVDIPDLAPYLAGLPLAPTDGKGALSMHLDMKETSDGFAVVLSDMNGALTKVALNKPDAENPSVSFDSLAMTGGRADLSTRIASVASVALSGPRVRLVREADKTLDLMKLFVARKDNTGPAQAGEAEAAPAPETPWQATVAELAVEQGRVDFLDRSLEKAAQLAVHAISATVRGATTEKGKPLSLNLSARWQKDGKVRMTGSLVPDSLKFKGNVRLDKLALAPLDPYLAETTRLLLAGGAVSGDLKITYQGGETPGYTAKGDLSLADLLLKNVDGGEDIMGLGGLQITDLSYSNTPESLHVAEVALLSPWAALSKDDQGVLNLRHALGLPEPEPVAPEDPAVRTTAPAMEEAATTSAVADNATVAARPLLESVTIDRIHIAGGEVRFNDASVSPAFATRLHEIEGTLSAVAATAEARPALDMSAKLDATPIRIKGVVNPVVTPIYSDIALNFSGMELVPISPYAKKNIAYPITKGRLSADVVFKTENWVLHADNKLFIEQLELGPKIKDPDAPNIPVKLGMALLQDSNGDMELDLPVRGRLDDPNFRVGGIVFKVIIKLIFKAVTSPFALLGSIFGGGGEDLQFVPFDPGSAVLTETASTKLKTVAEALQKRPKLKLEVDGVVDATDDTEGLTKLRFNHKLKVRKYESLTRKERAATTAEAMIVAPEEYAEFLFEAYANEPDDTGERETVLFVVKKQPVPVMEKFLLDRILVTDQDLADLALQRARAVMDRLVELDPALAPRIFLLDRAENGKAKAGVPRTRADLGLR